MHTTDRLLHEQRFHDTQAAERAERFADLASLRFRDADYLDHESWIRPAIEMLGDVTGKRVLDFGCGHGMAATVFARRGATVTGIDVSKGYVEEARRRAIANEVVAEFIQADAEMLPFPDASFDAVWGSAILHHLDMKRAGQEIRRILKPGGVAVFCEPWRGNPILNFARRYLPYPGKHRTPDERPLNASDLEPLHGLFLSVQVQGHQFLGMGLRAFGREEFFLRLRIRLDRLDRLIFRVCPSLENWTRYVVIRLGME